jgi:hypothetical protein
MGSARDSSDLLDILVKDARVVLDVDSVPSWMVAPVCEGLGLHEARGGARDKARTVVVVERALGRRRIPGIENVYPDVVCVATVCAGACVRVRVSSSQTSESCTEQPNVLSLVGTPDELEILLRLPDRLGVLRDSVRHRE